MTTKAPRTVRFRVEIRTAAHSDGDLPGFLDMLRYEGGQVVAWDRTERGFKVTIEVEANRFVPDRWASFMLFPEVL